MNDGRVKATMSFALSILIAQRQVIQSRAAWAALQVLQELLELPTEDARVKFITSFTYRRLQTLLDATAASNRSIANHPKDPALDKRPSQFDLTCGSKMIAALSTLAHDSNSGLSAAVNVFSDFNTACKDPAKGDLEHQVSKFLSLKKDLKPGQSAADFESSVRRQALFVNNSHLPYGMSADTLGYKLAEDGSGNLAMTSEPAISISIGVAIFKRFQYEPAFHLCFVDGDGIDINPAKDPLSVHKLTSGNLDRFDANQQTRSITFRAAEKPKKQSGGNSCKGSGRGSGSSHQNAAEQGHSFGVVVRGSKGGRGRSLSSERRAIVSTISFHFLRSNKQSSIPSCKKRVKLMYADIGGALASSVFLTTQRNNAKSKWMNPRVEGKCFDYRTVGVHHLSSVLIPSS